MTTEQATPIARQQTSPSVRNRDIDVSKGIAICLVVLGHVLLGLNGALGQSASRNAAITLIYTFHMALFFVIAGGYSGRSTTESRRDFSSRVMLNFLHPYFLWGVILTGIGYLMRGHTNVSTDRFDPLTLLSLLYLPPAVLWFLDFLLIALIVLRLTFRWPVRVRLALAISLIVSGYFLDVWLLNYLRYVGIFLLAAQFGLPSDRIFDDRRLIGIASFVMTATAVAAWTLAPMPLKGIPALHIFYLPAAFAGTFAVLWTARVLQVMSRSSITGYLLARSFEILGRRSMPIFLTHILFTAGARIIMLRLGMSDVWLVGTVATLLGLIVPLCMAIIADHFAISRYLGWPSLNQPKVNFDGTRQGKVPSL